MAKLVALEWDALEARVAVGRARGRDLVVEAAFAVDMGPVEGETREPEEVGKRLGAALAARGVGKAEALVGVARSLIELRQMQLPPCPDEEQADMVRLQAMRQFAAIGEDWPLDFVNLQSPGEDEAIEVVAASINPELVERVHESCRIADLTAKRLVLRPFAAASLYRRETGVQSGCRMLVDVLANEADLTVLVDGQVVFMRTVRLPHKDAQAKAILGEIRRTIGAAQNQTGGRRVEHLILCGDASEHAALKAVIDETLSLDIDFFDPFAGVHIEGELEAARPDLPGSYAPLLGMLAAEVSGEHHNIDFLNPRRRPKAKSKRREYGLVGAGVALIALLAGGFIWMQLGSRNKELAGLRKVVLNQKKLVEKSVKLASDIEEIEEFVRGDITWLDELREISDRLPEPDQAIITNLVVTPRTNGDGQITLEGLVDKSARVSELERALKFDENHRVIPKSTDYNDKGVYKWRFNETIVVAAKSAEARYNADRGEEPTDGSASDKREPPDETPKESQLAEDQGQPAEDTVPSEEERTSQPEEPGAVEQEVPSPETKEGADEDKPDEDKPDEDKPDEDKPDEDKPDEDKPDEDKPDEDKPEGDKPDAKTKQTSPIADTTEDVKTAAISKEADK